MHRPGCQRELPMDRECPRCAKIDGWMALGGIVLAILSIRWLQVHGF